MKRPDLKIPTYDGSLFSWHNGEASIDASDLGIKAGCLPGERVWNDSIDVGFWVTGRVETRLYTLVETKKHGDGEFFAWVFADAGIPDYKITVYND